MKNSYSPVMPPICNLWPIKSIVGHYIDSKSKQYISYVAAGYIYRGIPPNRNPTSKWYTSPTLYPDIMFPSFLSGTSYILSTNLIPLIIKQIYQTPMINLEDVYITGLILNKALNFKLSHVEGWSNFRPRWDDACYYQMLLTAHGLNSEEMLAMTESVRQTDCNHFLKQLFTYFNKFVSYYIPKYKF